MAPKAQFSAAEEIQSTAHLCSLLASLIVQLGAVSERVDPAVICLQVKLGGLHVLVMLLQMRHHIQYKVLLPTYSTV